MVFQKGVGKHLIKINDVSSPNGKLSLVDLRFMQLKGPTPSFLTLSITSSLSCQNNCPKRCSTKHAFLSVLAIYRKNLPGKVQTPLLCLYPTYLPDHPAPPEHLPPICSNSKQLGGPLVTFLVPFLMAPAGSVGDL